MKDIDPQEHRHKSFAQIIGELVLADAIYYRFADEERQLIWMRSSEELIARGEEIELVIYTLACESEFEVECFKAIVHRLKYGDCIGPSRMA